MEKVQIPKPSIQNGPEFGDQFEATVQSIVREELAGAVEEIKKKVVETIVNMISVEMEQEHRNIWMKINENSAQIEINTETNAKTRSNLKFHDHVPAARNRQETQ